MASMRFGYTILYVRDVAATLDFYERAFDQRRRFVHESGEYAELETGSTTLAFATHGLVALSLPDAFRPSGGERRAAPAFEVCFVTDDVPGAFARALDGGREPRLSPPQVEAVGAGGRLRARPRRQPRRARLARQLSRGERRYLAGAGVDVVEQRVRVVELEVLGEVGARSPRAAAAERHVERDQPRALVARRGLSGLARASAAPPPSPPQLVLGCSRFRLRLRGCRGRDQRSAAAPTGRHRSIGGSTTGAIDDRSSRPPQLLVPPAAAPPRLAAGRRAAASPRMSASPARSWSSSALSEAALVRSDPVSELDATRGRARAARPARARSPRRARPCGRRPRARARRRRTPRTPRRRGPRRPRSRPRRGCAAASSRAAASMPAALRSAASIISRTRSAAAAAALVVRSPCVPSTRP